MRKSIHRVACGVVVAATTACGGASKPTGTTSEGGSASGIPVDTGGRSSEPRGGAAGGNDGMKPGDGKPTGGKPGESDTSAGGVNPGGPPDQGGTGGTDEPPTGGRDTGSPQGGTSAMMDAGIEVPVDDLCNPELPPPAKCEAQVDYYGTVAVGAAVSWGGHCYGFWPENGKVGFDEAQIDFCTPWGGTLWTVNCAEEMDAVTSLLPPPRPNDFGGEIWRIWVGGTDEEVEGTWKWLSGQPWDPVFIPAEALVMYPDRAYYYDYLTVVIEGKKHNRPPYFLPYPNSPRHFVCER